MKPFLLFSGLALTFALTLSPVQAQEHAIVVGRVTNTNGAPEAAVMVRIETLNVGTSTAQDGSYRLVIPGRRVKAGDQVTLSASRQGLKTASRSIKLNPGEQQRVDFKLESMTIDLGE